MYFSKTWGIGNHAGHGVPTMLLTDLELDGKPVAVPPGHVAHFPPLQHLVAVDEVFQYLLRATGRRKRWKGGGGGGVVGHTGAGRCSPYMTENYAREGKAKCLPLCDQHRSVTGSCL